MKLTIDSGCLIANAKSNQLVYGNSAPSPVAAYSCCRIGFSAAMPFAAATRDVEHGEVERQADEAVAHGLGDELVDLVRHLSRAALEDGAGGLAGGQRHGRRSPGSG